MNCTRLFTWLVTLVFVVPLAAAAQSDRTIHPLLEYDFFISAGAFFPDKDFRLRVDGSAPNEEYDFDEIFKVNNSETTPAAELRWRFGDKWSLQGQYWRVSDGGSSTLKEDIHWQDVVFEKGSNVGAGIELDVARVFLGRRFSTSEHHEFGLGLGLHWLEIDAFIQGEILSNVGDGAFYRGSVSADAPLPNIGAWYTYAWSPRWALVSRVDWLSVSLGKYSGGLWNAQVGVHWAVSKHVSLLGAWNYFGLDIDVDKTGWHGAAELSQSGPFVGLTASW